MLSFTCREILEATAGKLICGDPGMEIYGVSTDSRKIRTGDLFIPLEGERFDGHDYITVSLEAGAAAALTHKEIDSVPDKFIIKVANTQKALGDLARYYRSKFHIPFVAITGSVGKTSTKDMIWSVLKQKYNVLKTEGNFNNEIGLPLTIFNLENSHEAGILEMGMSGFGEISRLTNIVKPNVAVLTNVGMAHIEKLGSKNNILKAKMEILEGLSKDGLLVLNGDDSLLNGLRNLVDFRTVFYGMDEGNEYQAYNVQTFGEGGTYFEVTIKNTDYKIHVPTPGIHNVYNALAAIAVGLEMKMSMEEIAKGISEFSPGKMRLNIIEQKGIKIINDAYNASPQSMEAAITVLKDIGAGGRTIAVLGDMLEMGDFAPKAHSDIGKFAVSNRINYIITVGTNARHIAEGARKAGAGTDKVLDFKSCGELVEFLKSFLQEGDVVLVKGSRGMKMEQIVDSLISGI